MRLRRLIAMLVVLAFSGIWLAAARAVGSGPHYFSSPDARAPFSAAVRVGDVIYLSGQIGAAADGSIPADFGTQARLAMDHLGNALKMAGAGFDNVFACTVMLADMRNWSAFNHVYVGYFKPGRMPVRKAFGATGLAMGAGVEVECQAAAPAVGVAPAP